MSGPAVDKLCHEGRDFLKRKDYAAAVESFQQAVTLDPDSCDAHEGLATCAYVSGDMPTAIVEYQRLTQLQPMESRYLTNLGAIHNRLGEHMKACDFLRKAIQRNKKCAESYYNLGIAQRKLKQNAMAVSAYKEAIRLCPMMVEAHQNLGNVYVDMGNLQMAIASFKKALEIKPDFEKARAGLEKAEEQVAQSKNKNSAMGRLNAMESTVTNVGAVATRELREDERYEDRKCLRQLAEEIERVGQGCADHLRRRVVPAILEIERAIAHGPDEAHFLVEAAENFRAATSQWSALRQSLKDKVAELESHEHLVGIPDQKA